MLSLVAAIFLPLFWPLYVLSPVVLLQLSNCQIYLAMPSNHPDFILASGWEIGSGNISNLYMVLGNWNNMRSIWSWHGGDCVMLLSNPEKAHSIFKFIHSSSHIVGLCIVCNVN